MGPREGVAAASPVMGSPYTSYSTPAGGGGGGRQQARGLVVGCWACCCGIRNRCWGDVVTHSHVTWHVNAYQGLQYEYAVVCECLGLCQDTCAYLV